jgi:hypothetical protein
VKGDIRGDEELSKFSIEYSKGDRSEGKSGKTSPAHFHCAVYEIL